MPDKTTMTIDLAGATDVIIMPRREYDFMQHEVSTLSNLRIIFASKSVQDFTKAEIAAALLFPTEEINMEGAAENA